MKLLKNYTTPVDLYVIGANITEKKEDEEVCLFITDDYCSGVVKGNKNTNFWIETDGSMLILTADQFDKAIQNENIEDSEEMGVIVFKDFTGDVYVRLTDDEGNDCLKENPDLTEHLVYQYKDELENEWRDVELLFSGNYLSSEKKEIKNFINE